MLSLIIFCGVCCSFVSVSDAGDMGPGIWQVNYVNKCEEEDHRFKFDISQEKINRTHDGFKTYILLEEPFTKDFGIRVDICKHVDGGCKPFQVMSDDCFVNFVNKYAKDNVKAGLEMAGVDPPDFPITEGEYTVEGYVFDYNELPSDGAYGEYTATANILDKDLVVVGCLELQVEFNEKDEE